METPPLLHVYSPITYHDEAHIVGTKSALLKLRAAIDQAIEEEVGVETAFVADGEGFSLVVVCEEDDWDEFLKYDDPYVDRHGDEELLFRHPEYSDQLTGKIRQRIRENLEP